MKSLFVEIKPEKCSYFTQGERGGGKHTINTLNEREEKNINETLKIIQHSFDRLFKSFSNAKNVYDMN